MVPAQHFFVLIPLLTQFLEAINVLLVIFVRQLLLCGVECCLKLIGFPQKVVLDQFLNKVVKYETLQFVAEIVLAHDLKRNLRNWHKPMPLLEQVLPVSLEVL